MVRHPRMNIVELLRLRGLDTEKKIKLVRHQDSRYDLHELMTTGLIETYQACQKRPVLECDYMASFIGMSHSRARFLGVYRVLGRQRVSQVKLPHGYSLPEDPENYFYSLERVSGFEDLEERIVIDWGGSARSWHQWISKKEVLEVLPRGYSRPFPGYLDFVLPHDELQRIVEHPDSNREWHSALSNVAGIYLILRPSTGEQYVGSAHGSKGILGRWKSYAANGHSGNEKLRAIVAENSDGFREFRYSVLRTLSKSLSAREVVEYEAFYKNKLGTRSFGLNLN